MNSNYYIPNDPSIKNVIHSIWQVEHSPAFHKEQIIPKGVVELIFNFSDSPPITAQLGSRQYYLSNCFINGFNKEPVQVQLPKQQVFFGIQLQPLAVKKILRVPASEFSDIAVDLPLLDPGFHSLWQQLAGLDHFDSRVTVILGWLKRYAVDWQPQEQLMNHFLYGTNQHELSATALANTLCYSTRHLSRKLLEATGMNTEDILLYKKYLHAVELVHHTDLSLTAIAYQSNFSDQSHFIRTFKAYTAMTPGEYKRNKGYTKGHLYADAR